MADRISTRPCRRTDRSGWSRARGDVLALGILAAFILGACSGGGAATGPTAATSESGPGAPTELPSMGSMAPGGATAGAIDVCAIVTAADAAPLFSGPATASPEQGLTGTASGCSYSSKQTEEGFSMEVVTGDWASTYWSGNTPPQGQDAIPLAGIGDKAMRAAGGPDFVSIKGSVFCEIEVGSTDPTTFNDLPTFDANDKMTDDAATAFAEKLGPMCNKVFASQ